jgi:CRISPR-associated protein Cmr4
MGAGTAIGTIDNPIQRERHTGHPMMVGSGIKGALRHDFWARAKEEEREKVRRVFGPETNASDHAGAVSFSDAQIVLFPVRSLKGAYVYATCRLALARLQRLLATAGKVDPWTVPEPGDANCVVVDESLLIKGSLILESFQFQHKAEKKNELKTAANWLAGNALPTSNSSLSYFRQKIENGMVLLSDDWFGYFAKNATTVEPHVRINDESGTADEGGLFYTENLPPESLLVSLVMASEERRKKGESGAGKLKAEDVLGYVRKVDGEMLQIGGDATTGRGHVLLRFANGTKGK